MLGEVAVSTAGVMLCWGSCSVYCRCNVVLGEVAVSTAGVMLCWGKLQCLLQV